MGVFKALDWLFWRVNYYMEWLALWLTILWHCSCHVLVQVVGTVFTHHQKCVLVDTQGYGNNRKITAFLGGLDLCDGRYDTPEHRLFHDLDTVFKDDFHNPTIPVSKINQQLYFDEAPYPHHHLNLIMFFSSGRLRTWDNCHCFCSLLLLAWSHSSKATMAWLALSDWWASCLWLAYKLWATVEQSYKMDRVWPTVQENYSLARCFNKDRAYFMDTKPSRNFLRWWFIKSSRGWP